MPAGDWMKAAKGVEPKDTNINKQNLKTWKQFN